MTGDGSSGAPYQVAQSSSAAGLAVTDTATVDMTVTGSGVPGAPYNVSAAVKANGVMDLVGTHLGDGLTYDPVAHTVSAPGGGGGTVDPLSLISADADNVLQPGLDGLLWVPNQAASFWNGGGYGLATVTADAGGGLWELDLGAGHTGLLGKTFLAYAPAVGHTNVVVLTPGAGAHGTGSADPGYMLMLGQLA